jgi:hypothetical protein
MPENEWPAIQLTPASGLKDKTLAGLLFLLACLTSPCCTPLIVPLGLALLVGTPLAAWLGHYLGWVYGGLTLVSVLSFFLGLHRLRQKAASRPAALPLISPQEIKTRVDG